LREDNFDHKGRVVMTATSIYNGTDFRHHRLQFSVLS
jgi:hypothetical protein